MIAFYYGITGFACAFYYRRELFKSAKNFFLVGVAPVLGGLILFWVLYKSIIDLSKPGELRVGRLLVRHRPAARHRPRPDALRRRADVHLVLRRHREFFQRKLEVADPGSLEKPPPTPAETAGVA